MALSPRLLRSSSLLPAVEPIGRNAEIVIDTDILATSAVVRSYEIRKWADLVLRNSARQTNLSVASTRFLVLGCGAVAAALVAALTRLGGRVSVAAPDAVTT